MLGQRLKELRKEKKLTQKNVSEIIGVAPTTYASYETSKHEPSIEILIKLADLYKVSLDYLVGRLK